MFESIYSVFTAPFRVLVKYQESDEVEATARLAQQVAALENEKFNLQKFENDFYADLDEQFAEQDKENAKIIKENVAEVIELIPIKTIIFVLISILLVLYFKPITKILSLKK